MTEPERPSEIVELSSDLPPLRLIEFHGIVFATLPQGLHWIDFSDERVPVLRPVILGAPGKFPP